MLNFMTENYMCADVIQVTHRACGKLIQNLEWPGHYKSNLKEHHLISCQSNEVDLFNSKIFMVGDQGEPVIIISTLIGIAHV